MAEISVILTRSDGGTEATAVAVAESGTGVGKIPPAVIAALLQGRDKIVDMMMGAPRMTTRQLVEFGRSLRQALFYDEVGATWSGVSSEPLITKIVATTDDLKAIPWEYVAWPSGADGPQLMSSVVRLVPESRAARKPALDLRNGFRVLLLSASPQNMGDVPWPDIRDSLLTTFQTALQSIEVITDTAPAESNCFLRIVSAANETAVRRAIRNDDPHIVHFVGHGTDKGIALIDGNRNLAAVMDANAFGAALQLAQSCRLVILSACDTANAMAVDRVNDTIGTFAEQIVRNSVPAAIASQTVIDPGVIATFCEGLYLKLLESGSIDMAVAAGRCNVGAELGKVSSAAIEWGIPVLYRSLGGSQLFARGRRP